LLPLNGIKVIDLSRLLAGPYCAMLLADFGAEVIKVEPVRGEDSRWMGNPPQLNGESFLYLCANRNKKGITLNLKSEKGKEILFRLLKDADVIIENFLPSIKKDLGIEYDIIKKYNPEIIYCFISSFGEEGPYKEKPGLDIIFQTIGGIMSISGEPDGIPMKAGAPLADMSAAIFSAFGIMMALFRRERTGKGGKISVSLFDSLIALQSSIAGLYFATGENPPRLGTGSPVCVPSQLFKTKDNYIAISVFNERTWKKFCEIMDIEEIMNDNRFKSNNLRIKNRKELIPILEDIFIKETTDYWITLLEKERIPCAPLMDYKSLFNDPQVIINDMVKKVYHSICGEIKLTGNPVKLSDGDIDIKLPPPILGNNNFEILSQLGYSKEEIENFKKNNII